MSGKGYLSFDDGSFYEGQFLNNLYHGRGFLQSRSFKYEGEFKNGEFDGLGVKTEFNRGLAFEGEWQNGKRNGDVNLYAMKLESASVWKEDKKVEVSEIKISTQTSEAINLNYSNINKTNNEFKDFVKKITGTSTSGQIPSLVKSSLLNIGKTFSDSPNKPNIPAGTVPIQTITSSSVIKETKIEEIKKEKKSSSEEEDNKIKEKTKASETKETTQGGPTEQDKNCTIF